MMNNKMLSWIFVVTLFFGSCSDDSDDNTNTATFNGESFSLDKGFLEPAGLNYDSDGEPIETYAIDVYLMSATVEYNSSVDEFSGEGNLIALDLNTSEENELASGTYTYSDEKGLRDEFVLSGGEVYINYDVSVEAPKGEEESITGGTIEVSINGDEITFLIDLTTESSTFTGTYTGTLQSI
ncbi:MAG: hypothetical protein ABJF11_03745 [Reichenbachiella sp.]|uniref:hypothetical protein n=1 Tax=Reichenbachiella sp. TaxID=2184521 RepID=UPI0032661299